MRASKRSRNYATQSPSHLYLRDDVKADIARSVRTFALTQFGGTCMMRAVTGNILLRELGLDAKLAVGAMLYRAGAEPIRDTMAYCHHNNVGRLIDGGLCGHVWNELDGDIIDFSCGEWLGEAALWQNFIPMVCRLV